MLWKESWKELPPGSTAWFLGQWGRHNGSFNFLEGTKAQRRKAQSMPCPCPDCFKFFLSLSPSPLMFPWMDASFEGHPGTRPSHSPEAKCGIQSRLPPNERTRWYRAPPRAAEMEEKGSALDAVLHKVARLAVGLDHGAKTCPQSSLLFWQRARGLGDAVSKLADAPQSCQPEAK